MGFEITVHHFLKLTFLYFLSHSASKVKFVMRSPQMRRRTSLDCSEIGIRLLSDPMSISIRISCAAGGFLLIWL